MTKTAAPVSAARPDKVVVVFVAVAAADADAVSTLFLDVAPVMPAFLAAKCHLVPDGRGLVSAVSAQCAET